MISFQVYDNKFQNVLNYLEESKHLAEDLITAEIDYLKKKYCFNYLPIYYFSLALTIFNVVYLVITHDVYPVVLIATVLSWYVSHLTRTGLFHYFTTVNVRLICEIKIQSVINIIEQAAASQKYQNPNNPPPFGHKKNNPFDRN